MITLLFFSTFFPGFSLTLSPVSLSHHDHTFSLLALPLSSPLLHRSSLILSRRTPHVHAYAHPPRSSKSIALGAAFIFVLRPRIRLSSRMQAHTLTSTSLCASPRTRPFASTHTGMSIAHSHHYLIPLTYPRSHTGTRPLACTLLHAPSHKYVHPSTLTFALMFTF